MKRNIISNYYLLYLTSFLLLTSCGSDNEQENSIPDPVLLEEYYFKGILGNEPFNLNMEIYDYPLTNSVDKYTIDMGGFDLDRIEGSLNGQDVEYCYGRYAFGIIPNYGLDQNIPSARLYFTRIDLDICSLENEILSLEEAFNNIQFVYSNSISDYSENKIIFAYYPLSNEIENGDHYFSYGENTDATFEITSVTKEEDPNYFILEGNFSCKMYSHLDNTQYLNLEDGKFRIRVYTNLDKEIYTNN